MRIYGFCLTLVFILLSSSTAWNAEIEQNVESNASSVDYTDTIGVGTEGYGSPISSDRIMGGEIIGTSSGNFHPFLSFGAYYTDNLFKRADNESSDNVMIITPGFWVAAPGTRQKSLDINTMNTAPGGLALSRFYTEPERRFQSYALYRADIREHEKFSEENHVDQRAEGSFTVNLRGGLSVELSDVYEISRDPYGTGGTSERRLDKFKSNYFNAALSYRFTPKTMVRLGYSNFYLDYEATDNGYRNRTDDALSVYAFYRLTPKTTAFVQVEHINIDYDLDINSDSEELNFFAGLQMKTSAKTRSRIKVGYGNKDYDHNSLDERDEWLAEAQFDYFITPKTSLYLKGFRRVHETDSLGSNDILTYRAQVGYRQRVTAKIRGEAAVYLRKDEYDGQVNIGGQIGEREDDYLGFTVALGYSPLRWINLSLGYEYRERDSNFNTEDYQENVVFVRLTAAL